MVEAELLRPVEQELVTEIMSHIAETFVSPEYQSRLEAAWADFAKSQAERGLAADPTPEVLKRFLEHQKIFITLNDKAVGELERLEAAGVIRKAPGRGQVEATSDFLFPRSLLRVGYTVPQELSERSQAILESSRAAWQGLGNGTKNFLDWVGRAWGDWMASLGPGDKLEGWNPDQLYDSGSVIYRNESEAIFVFSTTSGIVVPSEFNPILYGSANSQKVKARERYFSDGLLNHNIQLKRFYQWDRYGTALGLYRNCQERGKALTRAASIEILARALQMPNFEITEADFGREDLAVAEVKNKLTLTSRRGVARSKRSIELRPIAHVDFASRPTGQHYIGILQALLHVVDPQVILTWDSEFLTATESSHKHTIPWVMYHKLYMSEVVRIIKRWDDPPLDESTARQRAMEVFDQLYREGEQIVGDEAQLLSRQSFFKLS